MKIIKVGMTVWGVGGLLAAGALLFLRKDYFYYGTILSFVGAVILIVGLMIEIWGDL